MATKLDYYQILGIKRAATQAEIKEAYRFKTLAHHPDRFTTHFKEQAEEELKSINAAYEILGDPRKKAIYDTELDQEEHPNKNEQFIDERIFAILSLDKKNELLDRLRDGINSGYLIEYTSNGFIARFPDNHQVACICSLPVLYISGGLYTPGQIAVSLRISQSSVQAALDRLLNTPYVYEVRGKYCATPKYFEDHPYDVKGQGIEIQRELDQRNELKLQRERVKKETEERRLKEKEREKEIKLIIAIAGMLVLGWFGWSWWSHDTSAPSEITNPVTAEDWYNRGIDLKMGHWNEEGPLQAWNMAIQIDPQSETAVKAWHEKGLYFANLAKYDESIQAYDKAIQLIQIIPHENRWEALIFEDKGIALYRQGKYDESIQAFDRAIELDNFAEYWQFKGDVLKAAGRTSEADAA
jgi:tetratricopeptide (TPR) repeat protein